MGDHLVLMVDRQSSNSGLGTVNREELKTNMVNDIAESASAVTSIRESKLVQCRICHDDDEDCKMDTPCSCSGTLKFAHRDCVQRWCNEKGDIVCEICRQQFESGYTAPRKSLFHYTVNSVNFRSDWGIEGLDFRNPHFLMWDAVDDYEFSSFHSPRSLICCRIMALLLILLLFLRHSLPVFLCGINGFSLTLLILPLVRTLGILLVAYLFIKTFIAIQRCMQQRDPIFSGFSFDEETATPQTMTSLSESSQLHVPVN